MKYVEFELYIPGGYMPTNLFDVESRIEIGSAAIWDKEEISVALDYSFYNKLKSGTWNYIRIPLTDFTVISGNCNFQKINLI